MADFLSLWAVGCGWCSLLIWPPCHHSHLVSYFSYSKNLFIMPPINMAKLLWPIHCIFISTLYEKISLFEQANSALTLLTWGSHTWGTTLNRDKQWGPSTLPLSDCWGVRPSMISVPMWTKNSLACISHSISSATSLSGPVRTCV